MLLVSELSTTASASYFFLEIEPVTYIFSTTTAPVALTSLHDFMVCRSLVIDCMPNSFFRLGKRENESILLFLANSFIDRGSELSKAQTERFLLIIIDHQTHGGGSVLQNNILVCTFVSDALEINVKLD